MLKGRSGCIFEGVPYREEDRQADVGRADGRRVRARGNNTGFSAAGSATATKYTHVQMSSRLDAPALRLPDHRAWVFFHAFTFAARAAKGSLCVVGDVRPECGLAHQLVPR